MQTPPPSMSRYNSPPIEEPSSKRVSAGGMEVADCGVWGPQADSENSKYKKLRMMAWSTPDPANKCKRTAPAGHEEGESWFEFTVRGKLHWISVMKDRNWEGKVNPRVLTCLVLTALKFCWDRVVVLMELYR